MEENVEKEKKSKIIKKYIFISFLALSIIISTLLIVKYNVEGEKNLPFEIENKYKEFTRYKK